jgi:hypothetical protein
LLTANLLLQRFYKLLFLAITGAQANIPTPRIEGVLFPNFVSCEFNGPDFFNEAQHFHIGTTNTGTDSLSIYITAMPACQCEHLFCSGLTWASPF